MEINELVADRWVRITFAGSFQCRLATDYSPQDASPTEWKDVFPDIGWTFSYDEVPFDRVIRLSRPVALRTGLMDEWVATKVTKVEVSASALGMVGGYWGPMMEIMGDPLLGQVVALGDEPEGRGGVEKGRGAKFNSSHAAGGGGTGFEVLDDFAFSIGGMLFMAKQARKTKMTGIADLPDGTELEAKYRETKLDKVLGAAMPAARKKHLTTFASGEFGKRGAVPRAIGTYASFYKGSGEFPEIPLNQVQINSPLGVLAAAKKVADQLTWTLRLTFSRFDGDTLTGKINGALESRDSKLDRGKR
jgi:hypothetical protein